MKYLADLPSDLPESEIGGKARGLCALQAAGFRVPPAFVVLSRALDEVLAAAGDPARLAQTEMNGLLVSEIEAALLRLGPGPVAVRSSGVGEDGRTRSFAGIHDTFLEVEGVSEVVSAIKRCWLSAFSEKARAYRSHDLSKEAPRLAVVVQRMAQAEVAGVAFSCDPVARRSDRVVVEAVAGLGDALVSGRATPDRAWLDRSGGIIKLLPAVDSSPCLETALAQEVCRAVVSLEVQLGFPVDLEWAAEGGRLHLLQVRPVTTPLRAASSGLQRIVWSSTNAAEVLPGVVTPMTFAVAERYVASLVESVLTPFGVDCAAVRPIGLVAGRVYFNVNAAIGWLRTLPWMQRRGLVDLAKWFGGDQCELAEAVGSLQPEDLPTASLPWWRFLLGALRVSWAILKNQRADGTRALEELCAETQRDGLVDLRALEDQALVAHLERLSRMLMGAKHALEGVSAALVGMLCAGLLPVLTARWLGERSIGTRLLQGIGGLDSAEAGLALIELGRMARDCGIARELEGSFAQVEARLRETATGRRFLEAFQLFLRRHGHHCRAETDVSVARWAECPEYLLSQVSSAASRAEDHARVALERRKKREALLEDLRLRLGPIRRRIVLAVLERAARGVTARENGRSQAVRRVFLVRRTLLEIGQRLEQRGIVEKRDDVFFLVLEEIGPALQGASVRLTVAERRRAQSRHLTCSPPPVVVGEYQPVEVPSQVTLLSTNDTILRGIAASPGIAEGPARVIQQHDQSQSVQPGEILVAPFTDPGWVPYLVSAAAVVMDFGGVLSHGSVVAREYGIPAVVNVGCATQVIRTGQLLRVDGTRGVVELIQPSATR